MGHYPPVNVVALVNHTVKQYFAALTARGGAHQSVRESQRACTGTVRCISNTNPEAKYDS